MKQPISTSPIVEPSYFSNWADVVMPIIANKFLLPLIVPISFITPNIVTIFSFVCYLLACLCLFLSFNNHLLVATFLLPLAYLCDCLDGQLARTKQKFSLIGDYLDKTLDVLKIYIITLSLSYAVYLLNHNPFSFILGFTACFFFTFRYYIKLETMFTSIHRDEQYLEKSSLYRKQQYIALRKKHAVLKQSLSGFFVFLWLRNRAIFFVDEAEFVIFTSIGALFNQLMLVLWILAISQTCIAFFRLFERGYQLATQSQSLLKPMRK